MKRPYHSALWMVGWSLTFSMAMIINKHSARSLTLPAIIVARCFFALMLWIPFIKKKNILYAWPWQILRALCMTTAMVCSYTAYRFLPTHKAAILGTLGPFFILLNSFLFFREPVGLKKWTMLALTFLGTLIIEGFHPTRHFFHIGPYESIALCGNFMASLAVIVGRILAKKNADSSATLFYGSFVPLTIMVFWLPQGTEFHMLSAIEWITLVGIGIFGSLSQLCYFSALRYAKPSFLAPFEHMRLCMLTILGMVLFQEVPTLNFYIGAAIIAVTTVVLTRDSAGYYARKKEAVQST